MKTGITNAKGGEKSNTLLTTTTDATETSGVYTLALSYLDTTPKVNDFIVFVDSGALTTLYKVTAVNSTNATLTKIGDVSSGSGGGGGTGTHLYQHNIHIQGSVMINGYDRYFRGWVVIINDNNLPFVKGVNYVDGTNVNLMEWLYNNGYDATTLNKSYPAYLVTTDKTYFGVGIGSDGTYLKIWDAGENTFQLSNSTITDEVVDLGSASINGGGGKQLYKHIIAFTGLYSTNSNTRGIIVIENDSNLPFVKVNDYVEGVNQNIHSYLRDKGFTGADLTHSYPCNLAGDGAMRYLGIGVGNDNYFYGLSESGMGNLQFTYTTITDTIIPL